MVRNAWHCGVAVPQVPVLVFELLFTMFYLHSEWTLTKGYARTLEVTVLVQWNCAEQFLSFLVIDLEANGYSLETLDLLPVHLPSFEWPCVLQELGQPLKLCHIHGGTLPQLLDYLNQGTF